MTPEDVRNAKSFKNIVGDAHEVFFEIDDLQIDGKRFLLWAKYLGCTWQFGKEIFPDNGADFHHIAMRNDGVLSYVADSLFDSEIIAGFRRIRFSDITKYIKNNSLLVK